jgi:hypothetical protein
MSMIIVPDNLTFEEWIYNRPEEYIDNYKSLPDDLQRYQIQGDRDGKLSIIKKGVDDFYNKAIARLNELRPSKNLAKMKEQYGF